MYCGRRIGSNPLFTESEKVDVMETVIAVVGSGGKTTRIHELAEKYRKMAEEAELAEMKKKALQQQAANRTGNF
jgi:hypothetical protein